MAPGSVVTVIGISAKGTGVGGNGFGFAAGLANGDTFHPLMADPYVVIGNLSADPAGVLQFGVVSAFAGIQDNRLAVIMVDPQVNIAAGNIAGIILRDQIIGLSRLQGPGDVKFEVAAGSIVIELQQISFRVIQPGHTISVFSVEGIAFRVFRRETEVSPLRLPVGYLRLVVVIAHPQLHDIRGSAADARTVFIGVVYREGHRHGPVAVDALHFPLALLSTGRGIHAVIVKLMAQAPAAAYRSRGLVVREAHHHITADTGLQHPGYLHIGAIADRNAAIQRPLLIDGAEGNAHIQIVLPGSIDGISVLLFRFELKHEYVLRLQVRFIIRALRAHGNPGNGSAVVLQNRFCPGVIRSRIIGRRFNALEGSFVHSGSIACKAYFFQVFAVQESMGIDLLKAGKQDNELQRGAIRKGEFSDGFDAVGENHSRQSRTAVTEFFFNHCNASREFQLGQALAVGKTSFSKGGDAVRNRNFRQAASAQAAIAQGLQALGQEDIRSLFQIAEGIVADGGNSGFHTNAENPIPQVIPGSIRMIGLAHQRIIPHSAGAGNSQLSGFRVEVPGQVFAAFAAEDFRLRLLTIDAFSVLIFVRNGIDLLLGDQDLLAAAALLTLCQTGSLAGGLHRFQNGLFMAQRIGGVLLFQGHTASFALGALRQTGLLTGGRNGGDGDNVMSTGNGLGFYKNLAAEITVRTFRSAILGTGRLHSGIGHNDMLQGGDLLLLHQDHAALAAVRAFRQTGLLTGGLLAGIDDHGMLRCGTVTQNLEAPFTAGFIGHQLQLCGVAGHLDHFVGQRAAGEAAHQVAHTAINIQIIEAFLQHRFRSKMKFDVLRSGLGVDPDVGAAVVIGVGAFQLALIGYIVNVIGNGNGALRLGSAAIIGCHGNDCLALTGGRDQTFLIHGGYGLIRAGPHQGVTRTGIGGNVGLQLKGIHILQSRVGLVQHDLLNNAAQDYLNLALGRMALTSQSQNLHSNSGLTRCHSLDQAFRNRDHIAVTGGPDHTVQRHSLRYCLHVQLEGFLLFRCDLQRQFGFVQGNVAHTVDYVDLDSIRHRSHGNLDDGGTTGILSNQVARGIHGNNGIVIGLVYDGIGKVRRFDVRHQGVGIMLVQVHILLRQGDLTGRNGVGHKLEAVGLTPALGVAVRHAIEHGQVGIGEGLLANGTQAGIGDHLHQSGAAVEGIVANGNAVVRNDNLSKLGTFLEGIVRDAGQVQTQGHILQNVAMLEGRIAHFGHIVAHGYRLQTIAVVEAAFADDAQSLAQVRGNQGIAVFKGTAFQLRGPVPQGHALQQNTFREGPVADAADTFAKGHGLQLRTAYKSTFTNGVDPVTNDHIAQQGAFRKGVTANLLYPVGNGHFPQRITVVKSSAFDHEEVLREFHRNQGIAILEGIHLHHQQVCRQCNGLQSITVAEGGFSNGVDAIGKGGFLHRQAALESSFADLLDRLRQCDTQQTGIPEGMDSHHRHGLGNLHIL